jgi:multiple sugar transport system permease protein
MKPSFFNIALRIGTALVFLLPIFWMVTASLRPPGTPLPRSLQLSPGELSLENFARVWELIPLWRFTLNSLRVLALAIPLTVLTSSWAGFAVSQLPRPSQKRWVTLSLVTLMVPGIALWYARFIIYKEIGIYNSIWALVAPAFMGTSAFFVLMYYRAFRRIPRGIYDSARLDGAGAFQTWRLIAMPLAHPTTAGVALLAFIYYWGDYVSPLLYLQSEKYYTVSVALNLLHQMGRSDWPLLMAASVLSLAAPILFFLVLQPLLTSKE